MDSEYGVEAGKHLGLLTLDNRMTAVSHYVKNRIPALSLYPNTRVVKLTAPEDSVVADLVRSGLAQVDLKAKSTLSSSPFWPVLEQCEAEARKRHLGMFEYGDFGLEPEV